MPRLIIGPDTKVGPTLSSTPSRTSVLPSNDLSVQYYLRKKRSRDYLKFFQDIDGSICKMSPEMIKQIMDQVKGEFPDLGFSELPIGYVSKCYLGHPYEVHILDLKLEIVEHYKEYESMPPVFERARNLAINPTYDLIEVYTNILRAISEDGEVSVI